VNPIEQVSLAWLALGRTLRQAWRPALWAPWLLLGAVEVGVVVLIWGYAHPAVSWVMAPLLRNWAGEDALHYPNVLRRLPVLFGSLDLVIGAILGSIMIGAATLLFAERFRGSRAAVGETLARAFRRSGTLVLSHLPFNLLLVFMTLAIDRALGARRAGLTHGVLVFAGVVVVPVVVQAVFLYVGPLVMLEGRSALGALRELPRTWRRGMWAALFLGLVMLLPLVPIHFLSGHAEAIAERGSPELIGWLAIAEVAVGLLVWFVLSGSACLVYLGAIAEPETGSAP